MQTPATSADTVPDPADIVIAQAETRQRRRRRWLWIIGVAGLLVGYPLSAGPMVYLLDRGAVPASVVPVVHVYFAPLEWALEHSKWVEAFYDWYLPFFKVRR